MANVIFGHNHSQNVCRKAELFLWFGVPYRVRMRIQEPLLFVNLLEVAKTIHENVIGVGGLSLQLSKLWLIMANGVLSSPTS